ncbi:MAG: hypothetical protein WC006_08690 [Bacilli bacterium]|nr:hypothetical protein [Bacilli bacterium]
MQPLFWYNLRNMQNPELDDTSYLNNMITMLIEDENIMINSYEYMLNNSNQEDKKIYRNLIKDSKTHINLLMTIYGNLNNKIYNGVTSNFEVIKDIRSLIIKNVEMSKKYRKILFGARTKVHRYMILDILIDNINSNTLLNLLEK